MAVLLIKFFIFDMPYFCSYRICKIINDTESESEKKSNSKSISSCNAAEKRKFKDDELDKSDISLESTSFSYNGHIFLIIKSHVNYKSEGYNYGNPSFNNEDYNRNNDKPSLDNKDYDEEDNKGDIEIKSNCSKTSEISSYISKENDELMDDNKKFEKSEMTKMSND
ncbi:hypothetical protein RhiirA5_421799 [Rhizophagus irregularis]|uniref:Uncharacterized protein n=1 Tax=Rhizophagus irregularis TaxID=588596 RepID=A0A2N0PD91_9GLOM|nr:hypothetical protein RhiirA5_421799 [Rhizophagus irregularis]PKC60965.1 hypothetical protein RhiirA1_467262 [Rhizophagus irregularis]